MLVTKQCQATRSASYEGVDVVNIALALYTVRAVVG